MSNPVLTESLATLGFGGVAGAAVGFATKKFTKLVALLIGAVFILLQGLVYLGWIAVDWQVVQTSTEQMWTDPQGGTLADTAWQIVSANLPFTGGFGAGFALGFALG